MQITIDIAVDTSKLDKIINQLDELTRQIVQENGVKCADFAKGFAPVDTGALRSSIESHMSGDFQADIQPHVHYAIYQELGFRHWISGKFIQNPYLVPAAEAMINVFLAPATWARLFT